jgi:hypothetical protein
MHDSVWIAATDAERYFHVSKLNEIQFLIVICAVVIIIYENDWCSPYMDSGNFVEQLTTAELCDMDVGTAPLNSLVLRWRSDDLSTTNDQDFSVDPFKACDVWHADKEKSTNQKRSVVLPLHYPNAALKFAT